MEPVERANGRTARHALKAACGLAAVLLGALGTPAAAGDDQPTLAELLRSGDLICELYRSGPYPRRASAPDMLLVFDEVGAKSGTARVVSNRRVGAHEVKLYAGETGVHLVEDLSGSVVVTTLLGCELRSRAGRCQRFSTVNAWHFDQSVHSDPDRAFRRLPGTSYAGYCEAWHMDDPLKAEK